MPVRPMQSIDRYTEEHSTLAIAGLDLTKTTAVLMATVTAQSVDLI